MGVAFSKFSLTDKIAKIADIDNIIIEILGRDNEETTYVDYVIAIMRGLDIDNTGNVNLTNFGNSFLIRYLA